MKENKIDSEERALLSFSICISVQILTPDNAGFIFGHKTISIQVEPFESLMKSCRLVSSIVQDSLAILMLNFSKAQAFILMERVALLKDTVNLICF